MMPRFEPPQNPPLPHASDWTDNHLPQDLLQIGVHSVPLNHPERDAVLQKLESLDAILQRALHRNQPLAAWAALEREIQIWRAYSEDPQAKIMRKALAAIQQQLEEQMRRSISGLHLS
jgi:ABC-type sugar transport system ATPase subunit